MKKIILFAAALTILASCSKNANDETARPDGKISFDTRVANNASRAAVSTFGPLNLTALHNSTDGFAVSTNGLGTGAEMNNVVVKYNTVTSLWNYTGDYFWPINATQNVNFTAYAPAGLTGVTMTGTGITVTGFTPATAPASQTDIIYAAPAAFNRNGSGAGGVALTFAHILTQVVFSVTTDIAAGDPTLNSIVVTVPSGTGAYNGTAWTASGSSQTYTLFNNNAVSSTAITSTPLLMIPQTLAAGTNAVVTFTLNGSQTTNTVDLSTLGVVKSWVPGTRVTYSITFSNTDLRIKFADPTVTSWVNAADGFTY